MKFVARCQGKSEEFDVPNAVVAEAHAIRWREEQGLDSGSALDINEVSTGAATHGVARDLDRLGDALEEIGEGPPTKKPARKK